MSLKVALLASAVAVSSATKLSSSGPAEFMMKTAKERMEKFRQAQADNLFSTVTAYTKYGPVTGLGPANVSGTIFAVNQYLGIPYAQMPVGNLRWKSPQPLPSSWPTGTLNAQDYREVCPQDQWMWGIWGGMSESCLHLNIFTPANITANSNLPVLFFVHGGSFVYGSGSFPIYDPVNTLNNMENVIYVTINYRLGPFGYLAGDPLKSESPDGSVGNYGLQDQRMALKFIHENIAGFGGDPTRVMLFGESAGGASTSAHLISPKSWPYFSRALIESGAAADWTAEPYDLAKTRFDQMAQNLGCSGAHNVLSCMRTADYKDVLAADLGNVTQAFLEWGNTIDGVDITDMPSSLFLQGKVAPVPIALGFNADEGTLFNSASPDLSPEDYPEAIAKVTGPALAAELVQIYQPQDFRSPWFALTAILGDSQLVCPGQKTAHRLVNATARPVNPGVFVYYFTHELAITHLIEAFYKRPLGVFHASELALVFNAFPMLLWGPGEEQLAQLIGRYWTRFAATGNPNDPTGNDPHWPEFGASGGQIAMFDTDPIMSSYNITLTENINAQYCNWWYNNTIPASMLFG